MPQVTVMSVVALVQADDYRGAARLIYAQEVALACDLVAKAQDLLSKDQWKAMQQTLHVPQNVTIKYHGATDNTISNEAYVAV